MINGNQFIQFKSKLFIREDIRNVTYNKRRRLKFLIIFIPIFENVYDEEVTYETKYNHYWRYVYYYNDNSIEYGGWEYDYTS